MTESSTPHTGLTIEVMRSVQAKLMLVLPSGESIIPSTEQLGLMKLKSESTLYNQTNEMLSLLEDKGVSEYKLNTIRYFVNYITHYTTLEIPDETIDGMVDILKEAT